MPSWQTEPCPPWCSWSPHTEGELPADRHHTNVTLQRPLSLEDPIQIESGVWEPEYLAAYLWQHVSAAEPIIRINKGESDEGFHLTLDEAQDVATFLEDLVTQGRAGLTSRGGDRG
jgi:hypothetical protein